MKTSFVYSNIHVYRFVMNLLYKGAYRQRFANILQMVNPGTRSICELCFGDTIVAAWCRSHGVRWTGIDFNQHLCERAQKLGFNAIQGDILSRELPRADLYVMAGSLYHFHKDLPSLFDSILGSTDRVFLSEPVRNLSGEPGLIGWWARRSANPGTGHAPFRYDERSLLAAIKQQQERKGFNFRVVSSDRDLLLEIQR